MLWVGERKGARTEYLYDCMEGCMACINTRDVYKIYFSSQIPARPRIKFGERGHMSSSPVRTIGQAAR